MKDYSIRFICLSLLLFSLQWPLPALDQKVKTIVQVDWQRGVLVMECSSRLDPQIIVIGEAPSRHLHYYTGYKVITQNKADDITFDLGGDKVHIYSSNPNYSHSGFDDEQQDAFDGYVGSITVETEYTLQPAK
ncbi:hypothetical protein ES707_05045 [subsurface metagenome]